MAMIFQIDWVIEEPRWTDARQVVRDHPLGSDYDRRNNAFWWLLSGELQFRHDDIVLFPRDRIRSSLERVRAGMMEMGDPWYSIPNRVGATGMTFGMLDFVGQFLRIVEGLDGAGKNPAEVRFKERDGQRQIGFGWIGDIVTISTNLYPDIRLHVPKSEFLPEAHRFLDEFILSLDQHVPGILAWESFARLRAYAQAHGLLTSE